MARSNSARKVRSSPWLLAVGAVALTAGCAQLPLARVVPSPAPGPAVAPVYQVAQPAGTAAGQYAVGRIDLAEGRVRSAIQRFQQALQLDPRFVEAHNGLGVAFGQQGRYAEAAEAFSAALALSPDAPHVLNNLGYAQLKAGQLPQAWVSLKRAIALDPRNPMTRENIVLVLAALPEGASTVASSEGDASGSASSVTPPEGAQVARVISPRSASLSPAAPEAGLASAMRTTNAEAARPVVAVVPRPTVQAGGSGYEVVVSAASASTLVQVAPGVYELRARAQEPVALSLPTAPVALSVPSAPPPVLSPLAASARSVVSSAPPVTTKPLITAQIPPLPTKRPAQAMASGLAGIDGLEVSNGVGIRHLAGRTARRLAEQGARVARVSDDRIFGRPLTEIHYRAGHIEQARAVLASLPVAARLVPSRSLSQGINVRLVIGKDLVAPRLAWLEDSEANPDA